VYDRGVFGDRCLGTVRIPLLRCVPTRDPPSSKTEVGDASNHLETDVSHSGTGDGRRVSVDSGRSGQHAVGTTTTTTSDHGPGVGSSSHDVIERHFRRAHQIAQRLAAVYTIDEWFLIPELRLLGNGGTESLNGSAADSLQKESGSLYKRDAKRHNCNINSSRDESDTEEDSFHISSSTMSGMFRFFCTQPATSAGCQDHDAARKGVVMGRLRCCSGVVDEMASPPTPSLALDAGGSGGGGGGGVGGGRKSRTLYPHAAGGLRLEQKAAAATRQKVVVRSFSAADDENTRRRRPRLRVRVRYIPLSNSTAISPQAAAETGDNNTEHHSRVPTVGRGSSSIGISEVHRAAMFGRTQLVLSMAEAMANAYPNVKVLSARCLCPGLRWTALDYAVAFGHRGTVRALIKRGHHGLLLLGKSPSTHVTPLHLAVQTKDLRMLRLVAGAMLAAFAKEHRYTPPPPTNHGGAYRLREVGRRPPANDDASFSDDFQVNALYTGEEGGMETGRRQDRTMHADIVVSENLPSPRGGESSHDGVEEEGRSDGQPRENSSSSRRPLEDELLPSPLDTCDMNGNTAFAVACKLGDLQIVAYLLAVGASISIANNRRYILHNLYAYVALFISPSFPFIFFVLSRSPSPPYLPSTSPSSSPPTLFTPSHPHHYALLPSPFPMF
jgi:ankyrin repeat protein